MSHLDARQRGGKAAAGSSGTVPRGASNGQPGANAAAGQTNAMQMLMQAQSFAQQQTQIKAKMKAIRAKYQGRSGRYSYDDTEEMRRLGNDLARAERFLLPGAADPDAVGGNVDQDPTQSIAKNATHHGAISPLPRGKPKGPGASGGGGNGNRVAAIDDAAMEEQHDDGDESGGDGEAGGGGDNGLSDLEKEIQRFNEAPAGHLAFVKEKIEPLLSRAGKARLLARDVPEQFIPPRPKAGTNGVWYHGVMGTTLFSPHHFSESQDQMACPICGKSGNVKANGWALPGRRVYDVGPSEWIVAQRLQCKACMPLFKAARRKLATIVSRAGKAQEVLQALESPPPAAPPLSAPAANVVMGSACPTFVRSNSSSSGGGGGGGGGGVDRAGGPDACVAAVKFSPRDHVVFRPSGGHPAVQRGIIMGTRSISMGGDSASQTIAKHLIATKALRCCKATTWILIAAQCSAIPDRMMAIPTTMTAALCTRCGSFPSTAAT